MQNNFDRSLKLVLGEEGGYVNNPKDPGGRTNLGVTQAVWEKWVGHTVTEQDMRNLTPDMVKPLYKRNYWDACQCDALPTGVDYLVFDFAVNAGVGQSSKTLQKCVGAVIDGIIGSGTISAIKSPIDTINAFTEAKEQFYRSLKTFPIFGVGWLARVRRSKKNALDMIGA